MTPCCCAICALKALAAKHGLTLALVTPKAAEKPGRGEA